MTPEDFWQWEQFLSTLTYEDYLEHCQWMTYALKLAQQAGLSGDIPVGAVILDGHGKLIAQSANRKERDQDPTAHAEILALRSASQVLGTWHLNACRLYVTLEPCPMCAGAIIQARIGLLVYGASEPKSGCIRTVINLPDSPASNHHLQVIAGIKARESQQLLQAWFAQRRD